MENFSYHVPFYIVNGGIALSGYSADLKPGQVGLFDRSTFSVATGSGNGKELFFAQGSNGGRNWEGVPVTETHKSPFFYGASVSNMYLSKPKRIVNEEWVLGFNGAVSSRGLTFEKGKPVRVKFLFKGQPSYRFFGGPKEFLISYTPQEDCAAPCTEGDCPDPIVDCLTHTQNIINLINEDTNLHRFGVQAKLVNAPFTAATPNMTKYCLSLCDNGDVLALQAVQGQAPLGVTIERTKREGSTSTYQFCQRTTASAPAAFTQSGSVLEAVCGSCSNFAGSTLVPAKDVYLIRRVVAATTDLTTDNAKDTFADTVGTAYNGAASDADKTFVGLDGAVAIVRVKVASGAAMAPIGSDVVTFDHAEPAQCTLAAPASVAWATCGVGIASSRTLKINALQRKDCSDADRISDLQLVLAAVPGIQIGTLAKIAGVACADDYTVQQDSIDCLPEDCITNNVTFTYAELPAFENKSWSVVPPVVTENAARKCGIRVTAGYYDPKNGNCSFDITSYYETEPVRFELSLLEDSASNCDIATWPSQQQTRIGQIARQSGEEVIREVILKDASYLRHIAAYENDPLMREKFENNIVGRVDRNAFYNLYYVTFEASYGEYLWRKNETERFTAVFAFKENDPAQKVFEDQILQTLTAKSGTGFHIAD